MGNINTCVKSAENLQALETRRVVLGLLQLAERVSPNVQPRPACLVSHASLILINVGLITVFRNIQSRPVVTCLLPGTVSV